MPRIPAVNRALQGCCGLISGHKSAAFSSWVYARSLPVGDFDVDAYVRESPFEVLGVFHKGEARRNSRS